MADYPYGYCGMPCTLCTRYHVNGKSKCLGCSYNGYYTDSCKVHHCCTQKRLIHCSNCSDFPCTPLTNMADFSDLNTNHVTQRTCTAISSSGFEPWYKEYTERTQLLLTALERYNNGRMKRFLCELFIQQDLPTLRKIMALAAAQCNLTNNPANAFRQLVTGYLHQG